MDVRRRISTDMEHAELEMSKERAYKLTSKIEKVETDEVETEEESYEQQTFRFNLHDYTIYKDMEEKRAMENLRKNQEQPETSSILMKRLVMVMMICMMKSHYC